MASSISKSFKPKEFYFEDEDDLDYNLKVSIPEVLDPDYGMYVWPSAPVLAQYIWHHRKSVQGKVVLELGAGTALPGIVAGKVGAKKVILSDSVHLPKCIENCRKSADMNQLNDCISYAGITWGEFNEDIVALESVDIILGSDCFYDKKDFEDLIVTISFLIEKNPTAQFWTTYQVRDDNWMIHHLLNKWRLMGTFVPLDSFHGDGGEVAGSNLPGRHEIHLYVLEKDLRVC